MEDDIPDLLQGEVARLDRRFHVSLNPASSSSSKTIHLTCHLREFFCEPHVWVARGLLGIIGSNSLHFKPWAGNL